METTGKILDKGKRTDLTKEEIQYIKSSRYWQKNQDLLIQSIDLAIHNSSEMVRIHTESDRINKEQREHEVEFTKNGMNVYFKWCEENNIDPYVTL